MRWEIETWRKLYTRIPPGWAKLPLLCRGLGSELLKYADDDGRIPMGDGESAADTVVRLGAAHKSEVKLVREHVKTLLKDGYLVAERDAVVIRNLPAAQARTNAAERMRKLRAKRQSEPPEGEHVRELFANGSVTPSVTSFANTVTDPVPVPVPEIPPGEASAVAPAAPRARKPRAKKPASGARTYGDRAETATQVAWRCWRATYAASHRRYGEYTKVGVDERDRAGDGYAMVQIARNAEELAAEHAPDNPGKALEELLNFWFRQYLRDDGIRNFLAEQRHPLRCFKRGISTYGTPWSKYRPPANAGQLRPPAPAPEHSGPPMSPEELAANREAFAAAIAQLGRGPAPQSGTQLTGEARRREIREQAAQLLAAEGSE